MTPDEGLIQSDFRARTRIRGAIYSRRSDSASATHSAYCMPTSRRIDACFLGTNYGLKIPTKG